VPDEATRVSIGLEADTVRGPSLPRAGLPEPVDTSGLTTEKVLVLPCGLSRIDVLEGVDERRSGMEFGFAHIIVDIAPDRPEVGHDERPPAVHIFVAAPETVRGILSVELYRKVRIVIAGRDGEHGVGTVGFERHSLPPDERLFAAQPDRGYGPGRSAILRHELIAQRGDVACVSTPAPRAFSVSEILPVEQYPGDLHLEIVRGAQIDRTNLEQGYGFKVHSCGFVAVETDIRPAGIGQCAFPLIDQTVAVAVVRLAFHGVPGQDAAGEGYPFQGGSMRLPGFIHGKGARAQDLVLFKQNHLDGAGPQGARPRKMYVKRCTVVERARPLGDAFRESSGRDIGKPRGSGGYVRHIGADETGHAETRRDEVGHLETRRIRCC